MTDNAHFSDVTIIGAGPVGLFGVFACGMLGLKTQVVDALPAIGGQCTALYPDKPIFDIPAFPAINGADLITALEKQAAPFHPTYHLGHAASTLKQDENGIFTITLTNNLEIKSKAILIAGGAGAFGPNRPPLENISDYENKSLFYAVRNPDQFRGKTVAIAGGGDSSIDWANILAPLAAKIYLIHRREQFRAAPASLNALSTHIESGKVEKITPFQLGALHGDHGQISALTLHDLDGNSRNIPADALLCFFGLNTSLGAIGTFGLELDGHQIRIDPATGETSRPGIFAAGDIATYPHKLKLILTGFSEISGAAHAIYRFLNPGQELHMVHSTTRGIPKP